MRFMSRSVVGIDVENILHCIASERGRIFVDISGTAYEPNL